MSPDQLPLFRNIVYFTGGHGVLNDARVLEAPGAWPMHVKDALTMATILAYRDEARSAGFEKFLTDKPCAHGHVCERYTVNMQCVECVRGAGANYRADNANKIRVYKRQWAQVNAERHNASSRKWARENKEKHSAMGRRWRDENPERNKEKNRRWSKENKDRHDFLRKTWKQNNKQSAAIYARHRRAMIREAEGTHTLQDIERLYAEQEGRCAWCGIDVGIDYHVDHIVALINGGGNGPDNLAITCPHCNWSKNDTLLEQWLPTVKRAA